MGWASLRAKTAHLSLQGAMKCHGNNPALSHFIIYNLSLGSSTWIQTIVLTLKCKSTFLSTVVQFAILINR